MQESYKKDSSGTEKKVQKLRVRTYEKVPDFSLAYYGKMLSKGSWACYSTRNGCSFMVHSITP